MEYIELKKNSKFPSKRAGCTLHNIGENKFVLIGF